MRAVLIIVLIAAGLWGGYWFAGSRALEQSVTGWFAAQSGTGLTAEQSGVEVTGFPNRFDLTVTSPRLTDQATGIGWSAPFAQVFAMTWKPWHVIATLPQEQMVTLPDQDILITSTLVQGSAVMEAGTDLTLDRTTIVADGLALDSTAGWAVSATNARFATRRAPDDATAHEVGVEITTFTPDAAFRMALQGQSDLPEQIDRMRIDARVDLSAPIDRHMGETRPEFLGLSVKDISLDWGNLLISGTGDITPAADGRAEGRIDVRVENWRELVPVLVASGLITPQVTETVTRAMELLAQQDGTPEVLDVPLVFQQGRMSLGPIPLGPAPLLR
jgi:hypothetical protein